MISLNKREAEQLAVRLLVSMSERGMKAVTQTHIATLLGIGGDKTVRLVDFLLTIGWKSDVMEGFITAPVQVDEDDEIDNLRQLKDLRKLKDEAIIESLSEYVKKIRADRKAGIKVTLDSGLLRAAIAALPPEPMMEDEVRAVLRTGRERWFEVMRDKGLELEIEEAKLRQIELAIREVDIF